MFHARTSDREGGAGWIPIREESSGPAPFDFAAERIVVVKRGSGSQINPQALTAEIRSRLDRLFE
jgi:hypothetical protein